jgi:hypothetical protein
MTNITIYVEGDGDAKFLQDFIQEHYNLNLQKGKDIIKTGGWGEISNKKREIEADKDYSRTSLIVFDADSPKNDGGFKVRLQQVIDKIVEIESQIGVSISYDIFLFPNDQDDGALENMLENAINPTNQVVFECWESFEGCLSGKENINSLDGRFTIPARKTKIYAYLETLLGETKNEKEKVKDPKRDFRNKAHWDLYREYPLILKSFFDKYLL